MTTRIYIIALLSVFAIAVNAQTTTSSNLEYNAIQSQQIIKAGAYNGTVYEPFSATTPSDQSEVGATYTPDNTPGGPRRVGEWGQGLDEYGQGPSPIGDAVLPLLLMAAAFGGVVYVRRRKQSLNAES